MRLFKSISLAVVLVVTVLIVIDATSGGVKRSNIRGTITRDGKPLEWTSEGGHLLVLFVPEDRGPNDNPIRAETDRDAGTYRIPEIKSGWYLVAIHQFDEHHQDALGNKFDPGNSPLRYKVTQNDQVIDIDVPKALPRGGSGKR